VAEWDSVNEVARKCQIHIISYAAVVELTVFCLTESWYQRSSWKFADQIWLCMCVTAKFGGSSRCWRKGSPQTVV